MRPITARERKRAIFTYKNIVLQLVLQNIREAVLSENIIRGVGPLKL